MSNQQSARSMPAEQALLGRLILASAEWPDASDRLAPEDFGDPQHRLIFETIAALAGADLLADAVIAFDALTEAENAEGAGESSHLAEFVGKPRGAESTLTPRLCARQLIRDGRRTAEAA